MPKNPVKQHTPLPKNTRAFICALCGAVALDPKSICKVQGMGIKADWCGTPTSRQPVQCVNRVHTKRFACNKCGQVAMNPELLCEPEIVKESQP
jgi:hypothetical protein